MNDNEGCLSVIVTVVGAIALWSYWDSAFILSYRFRVNEENIYIQKKPHDCEFLSAPIGRKHCSYEKVYQRYDASERDNRQLYVSYVKQID